MSNSYRNNFNEITLINNSDIYLVVNDLPIIGHIPTIHELYSSVEDRGGFLGVVSMTLEELTKDSSVKFENRLEFIKYILKTPGREAEKLTTFLQLCTHNTMEYVEELDILTFNGVVLDIQALDGLFDVLGVGMGYMKLIDFENRYKDLNVQKTQEELEGEAKEREYARRIQKTKSKVDSGVSLEKIIHVISYTFGTSFEELVNKNFYTLNAMYVSSIKIDIHNINCIAEGNGLVSQNHKHKHWINMN